MSKSSQILRWTVAGSVICLAIFLAIMILGIQPARANSSERKAAPAAPINKGTTESQAESPLPDPFTEFSDKELEADREVVEARPRVPKRNWQAERIANIDGETVQQLVEDLANFDDMHLAMTGAGMERTPLTYGSYVVATHLVVHLFRVRRLWAIEKETPGTVVPFMVTTYAKASEAWPAAYHDWANIELEAIEQKTRPVRDDSKPNDYTKVFNRATVATYFIGESGDPALLSVLLDGFQTHQRLVDEIKRVGMTESPVPPTFTLYAIHRLVSTTPECSLRTAEARAARKTYLSWAEDHILPPTEVEVTAWNAGYDESDPYRSVVDPENVLLRDQPKMTMVKYPSRFKDRTWIEKGHMPDLSKKEEDWRDRLFLAARAIIEK